MRLLPNPDTRPLSGCTGQCLEDICPIIVRHPMRLSVLDQSPIISGHTPAQAVHETIRLAKAAEQLGFYRYWLAEHHSIAALADPCPEILLARIAAATSTHPRRHRRHPAAVLQPAQGRGAVPHARGALSRAASTSASGARRAATRSPRSRWARGAIRARSTFRSRCSTSSPISTARCPRSTRSPA